MKWRKLCGWFAGRPKYSSRLKVTTREKSNRSSWCRRASSRYIPSMVLPVASPRRSAGFLRTALPTARAASRPSSSEFGFSISSISPPLGSPHCARVDGIAENLPEPPDEELVAVRAIKAQNVGDSFSFCRVDQLAYTHERLSSRDREEFGSPGIGSRGVDFLVGVAELHLVFALEDFEKRFAVERRR